MKKRWNPSTSIAYQINLISRLMAQRNEKNLRPLQLGVAHIPVLAALANLGPLNQKELAGINRVDQSTMALLLGRMETAGFIVRSGSPLDGRAVVVDLSDEGKVRLPTAKTIVQETIQSALHGFNKVETNTLKTLLQKLVTNLDSPSEGNES